MSVPWQMDELCGADPPARKSEGLTGAHVIGRLDTYRALEQRVVEGKALARELMCLTRPALGLPNHPLPGKQVPGCAGARRLWGSANTLHRVLEECASLLAAFWSATLPAGPAQHQGKEQALQGEIAALRAQLSEREDALQSTAERLRSTARLKDSMEQFIVSQLTRTHNVLRKARTNLEVKAQQALPVA
nr:PREDICTED: myomegalin [Struthio camelus australis]